MMLFNQRVIIKRWKPILEEYEKNLNKVSPVPLSWSKTYVYPIISQIKNPMGSSLEI